MRQVDTRCRLKKTTPRISATFVAPVATLRPVMWRDPRYKLRAAVGRGKVALRRLSAHPEPGRGRVAYRTFYTRGIYGGRYYAQVPPHQRARHPVAGRKRRRSAPLRRPPSSNVKSTIYTPLESDGAPSMARSENNPS